jgi:hypothetical protein
VLQNGSVGEVQIQNGMRAVDGDRGAADQDIRVIG